MLMVKIEKKQLPDRYTTNALEMNRSSVWLLFFFDYTLQQCMMYRPETEWSRFESNLFLLLIYWHQIYYIEPANG